MGASQGCHCQEMRHEQAAKEIFLQSPMLTDQENSVDLIKEEAEKKREEMRKLRRGEYRKANFDGAGELPFASRRSFDDVPDDFVLPSGSIERGQKLFKKHCSQCHSIYPDNRLIHAGSFNYGPTLYNIYGRASGNYDIAIVQGAEYPEGVLWVDAPLMNYMKNPRKAIQTDVQMNFRGITDVQTRADIVHYLKTLDHTNPLFSKENMQLSDKPSGFAPARWAQAIKEKPLFT